MNPNGTPQITTQPLVHDVAPANAAAQMPTPPPMFPVEAQPPVAAQSAPAQPTTEHPATPNEKPQPAQQAKPKPKSNTNWLVIGLALTVTAGLALAAYMALKTSS